MNIVIGQSVTKQQRTMQLRSTCDGTHIIIARRILLRRAHEALSIDGIIIAPAGGGSDGHTTAENFPTLAHRHKRVPTAIRPSPDGYTLLINVRLLPQPECRLNLIACLKFAQTLVDAFLELGTTTACSTIVDAGHYIALLNHILLENGSLSCRCSRHSLPVASLGHRTDT